MAPTTQPRCPICLSDWQVALALVVASFAPQHRSGWTSTRWILAMPQSNLVPSLNFMVPNTSVVPAITKAKARRLCTNQRSLIFGMAISCTAILPVDTVLVFVVDLIANRIVVQRQRRACAVRGQGTFSFSSLRSVLLALDAFVSRVAVLPVDTVPSLPVAGRVILRSRASSAGRRNPIFSVPASRASPFMPSSYLDP